MCVRFHRDKVKTLAAHVAMWMVSIMYRMLLVRCCLPVKLGRAIEPGDISRCGEWLVAMAIVLPAASTGRKRTCVYGSVRY
jgi:hypothetical protein